jgi:hypothetical protein
MSAAGGGGGAATTAAAAAEACVNGTSQESSQVTKESSQVTKESSQKSSQEALVCEVCTSAVPDEKYVGCCNDGDCPKKIENMCDSCGTWDDKKEVWCCPSCAAAPKDEVCF